MNWLTGPGPWGDGASEPALGEEQVEALLGEGFGSTGTVVAGAGAGSAGVSTEEAASMWSVVG